MTALSVQAPRRQRSTHRRTAEIVEAAARVFAERGFHGASTQDIADVLGIRQASLYYYFSSKEMALEMVCARGVEGHVEAAAAIAEGSGTAIEKLRRLVTAHLTPIIDRGTFVQVFLNERQHLPRESRRRIGKQARMVEKVFEDVLRAGIASGEFRRDLDPRLTTLALLGMANAVPAWYGKEPGAGIERIAAEFTRLAIEGVVARSKATASVASPGRRRPRRQAT